MQGKIAIAKEQHKNNNNQNFNIIANNINRSTENKQIFKIEEDEEGKEKIYHLEDDDEDDDDYEEDEEEENEKEADRIKKQTDKNKAEEKPDIRIESSLSIENKPNEKTSHKLLTDNQSMSTQPISQRSSIQEDNNNKPEANPINNAHSEPQHDWTESNYDLHTVVHRIYYKVKYVI